VSRRPVAAARDADSGGSESAAGAATSAIATIASALERELHHARPIRVTRRRHVSRRPVAAAWHADSGGSESAATSAFATITAAVERRLHDARPVRLARRRHVSQRPVAAAWDADSRRGQASDDGFIPISKR
jgi:hypothetical protein